MILIRVYDSKIYRHQQINVTVTVFHDIIKSELYKIQADQVKYFEMVASYM